MIASALAFAGCFALGLWLLGAVLVWRYTSDERSTRDRLLYAAGWPVLLAALVVMSIWRGDKS